jgi:anti-sigma B factor antagonist
LETAVVVRAAGEVDGTTAQQLEDPLLRAAETGAVQFDLATVPYMSSAGLRVLILAPRRCKSAANACAPSTSHRRYTTF